jgi:hypothetical protein
MAHKFILIKQTEIKSCRAIEGISSFVLFLAILTACMKPGQTRAQALNLGSPYSLYGPGDVQLPTLAQHKAVGSALTAWFDSTSLNVYNPAGLSGVRFTSLEMGSIGYFARLGDGQRELDRSNLNFSYLLVGFPVSRRWSTVFGFMPYSFVNYQVVQQVDSGFAQWREEFKGKGGLNQVLWVHGVSLGKNWHAGITTRWVFGSKGQERLQVYPYQDSLFRYNLRITEQARISDVQVTLGLQYRRIFDANKTTQGTVRPASGREQTTGFRFINAGISLDLPASFNLSQNIVADRFTYQGNNLIVRDTLQNANKEGLTMDIPMGWSAGVHWGINRKWQWMGDGGLTSWSRFRYADAADSLGNSWFLRSGFQFTPAWDRYKGDSRFKSIRYRMGMRYQKGPVAIMGESIDELGLSLGMGIPVRRILSQPMLHTTIEVARRGTLNMGLVREHMIKLSLGLTLNDTWFIKRKYD